MSTENPISIEIILQRVKDATKSGTWEDVALFLGVKGGYFIGMAQEQ